MREGISAAVPFLTIGGIGAGARAHTHTQRVREKHTPTQHTHTHTHTHMCTHTNTHTETQHTHTLTRSGFIPGIYHVVIIVRTLLGHEGYTYDLVFTPLTLPTDTHTHTHTTQQLKNRSRWSTQVPGYEE